mmetsp:Transcript_26338/g.87125  ORF Transcript_26338/g.87125 Transcript_26338/m.87125 type:complete len:578 (+) Transcript_26338:2-1735(+)
MFGGDDEDDDEEEEVEKIDPATLAPDLYSSCKAGQADSARELLDVFVPPFHTEGETGWTCLHWAARHGLVETVERLIRVNAAEPYLAARAARDAPPAEPPRLPPSADGGEEGEAKQGDGPGEGEEVEPPKPGTVNVVPGDRLLRNTPLHWASFHGHLRVAWLLLQAGYTNDDVDEVGNTPLHLAAAGGHAAVVRALLNDGSDGARRNDFSNAPAEVTTSEEVRALLAKHAASLAKTAAERLAMRGANLSQYRDVAAELAAAIESKEADGADAEVLQQQSARLRAAVAAAEAEAVAEPLVARGRRALARLETHIVLKEQVGAVKAAAPVISQAAYTRLVNKLKRLAREALALREEEKAIAAAAGDRLAAEDCGASPSLLAEAEGLALRSNAEYWLHSSCAPLDALPCADASCQRPMERLEKAIAEADAHRAEKNLVSHARALLSRFTAELELRRSMDAVPQVKLPVPDPEPDYWAEEDQGTIEETPEYPLPPESGVYIWHPSANLTKLRGASMRLEKALARATQCTAYPDLVNAGNVKHKAVSEELKQLERKDEEDKETAIAAAEKAAKKLKKKKKKK